MMYYIERYDEWDYCPECKCKFSATIKQDRVSITVKCRDCGHEYVIPEDPISLTDWNEDVGVYE